MKKIKKILIIMGIVIIFLQNLNPILAYRFPDNGVSNKDIQEIKEQLDKLEKLLKGG